MRSFRRKKDEKAQQPPYLVLPTETLSDELLLSAIASGAIEAMEVLYERYHRLLYSLTYRMVADHQVAEDLLQETFLAVWTRASSYSATSGAVRNWLVSIMHHRTIDYLRVVRRVAPYTGATLEEVEHQDSLAVPDVWDKAWQNIQSAQIREALMRLSTEQRMVIELAYFQGWTQSEIAEGCHLPLGTVKARMRLGLMHLKRILEQMGIREV
jgi:RNA polymerase sigma factor (sigma-70 family)